MWRWGVLVKVFFASLFVSRALEATSHQMLSITAEGAVERQMMRREETREMRKEPECYREEDWSSTGCPIYDQTKCTSYSEQECTSGCGDGKVCLKLFMVPLSYTCCEDTETSELFDRSAKDAVAASSKLGAGDPPPAPPPAPLGFGSETSASAVAAAEGNSAGTSEAAAECYRSNDWTKVACPKYDQAKCSSYSETDCTSGCGTGKVCVKLYMSPLSYTCCDDDTHQIFQRDEASYTASAPNPARTEPRSSANTGSAGSAAAAGAGSGTAQSNGELPFTGVSSPDGPVQKNQDAGPAQLAQLAG